MGRRRRRRGLASRRWRRVGLGPCLLAVEMLGPGSIWCDGIPCIILYILFDIDIVHIPSRTWIFFTILRVMISQFCRFMMMMFDDRVKQQRSKRQQMDAPSRDSAKTLALVYLFGKKSSSRRHPLSSPSITETSIGITFQQKTTQTALDTYYIYLHSILPTHMKISE